MLKDFPHVTKRSTGDLCSWDLAKPGSWTYHSRAEERINLLPRAAVQCPTQYQSSSGIRHSKASDIFTRQATESVSC
jgi:hypothetical protein